MRVQLCLQALLITAILVAHIGLAQGNYTLVWLGVDEQIGSGVSILCATSLTRGTILLGGSVGSPPRPYALLLNTTNGALTPLPVPMPPGAVKGEIVYCTPTTGRVLMVGYSMYPNGEANVTLWQFFTNGTIRYTVTPLVGIPLSVDARNPGISTVLGCFYGVCSANLTTLLILYDITGGLEGLAKGAYSTRYVMTRAYGGVGRLTCSYPLGVIKLLNTSIVVVVYGVNITSRGEAPVGILALLNPGEVVPHATILPFYPLAATTYEHGLVAAGMRPGDNQLYLLIVTPSGTLHFTRLRVEGSIASKPPRPSSVSCVSSICLIGVNWGKQAVQMVVLNDGSVVNATTILVPRIDNISLVYLAEDGKVVVIGKVKGATHVQLYSLTELQGTSEKRASRTDLLPYILVSAAIATSFIAIYLVVAKRRAGKQGAA